VFRLLSLIFTFFLLQGCASHLALPDKRELSAFGVFVAQTNQYEYKLTIRKNLTYQLCDSSACFEGKVESTPKTYGVILLDFYASEQGKSIELASFGRTLSDEFIAQLRSVRLMQPRANDLAFNLTLCGDNPCARIGHSRRGILFIKK